MSDKELPIPKISWDKRLDMATVDELAQAIAEKCLESYGAMLIAVHGSGLQNGGFTQATGDVRKFRKMLKGLREHAECKISEIETEARREILGDH